MNVSAAQLEGQLAAIFRAWGMREADIGPTTRVMVAADLRGIESHGATMMYLYDEHRSAGKVKMDRIDLFHTLTYPETSTELPTEVRKMVVGEKVEISGGTSDDCKGIDAVFTKNHPHWKEVDGKYSIERQEVKTKKLRLRKVPKPGG